jgi:hypothetical protein
MLIGGIRIARHFFALIVIAGQAAPSQHPQESRGKFSDESHAEAWSQDANLSPEKLYWEATLAFHDPGLTRSHILELMDRIARQWPETPFGKRAAADAEVLSMMITEDKGHSGAELSLNGDKRQRIRDLIFALRDQNGVQMTEPGECNFFLDPRGDKSPADQLVQIGYDAIPQLAIALEDMRFTRSVSYWRSSCFSHYTLRIGDCAHEVIAQITGRRFWYPSSIPSSISSDGQARKVKRRVLAWWEAYRVKGEARMLVQGAEAGDWDSPEQAKRLARLHGDIALEPIISGIKASRQNRIRAALVEVLTNLPGDRVLQFFQEECNNPCFRSRIVAAGQLINRGDDSGICRLIHEWNSLADQNELEDGWEQLVFVLANSRRDECILKLCANLSGRPVRVRIEVLEALAAQKATLSAECQQAVKKLLIGSLDDKATCPMAGTLNGREYRDPRVCDWAAQILTGLIKKPAHYDLCGTVEARDEQIRFLKSLVGMPE